MMVSPFYGVFIIWITLLAGPMPAVEDILAKVDENFQGTRFNLEMRQVITRANGEKRIMISRRLATDGGEKQVVEFTAPESIRGVRIFMLNRGENIRIYSPDRKEIVDLSPEDRKNSIMGSDLRYEDLYLPFLTRFSGRVLSVDDLEGTPCYVLSLRPSYGNSGYTRVLMWVDVMCCTIRQIDYYQHNESTPFKRMVFEDFREASGGRKYPWRWYMVDLINGGKTLCEVVDIQFPEAMDDSLFVPENLVKDNPGGN